MLSVFVFNTSFPSSIANCFSSRLFTLEIHGDKIVPASTKVYHFLLFCQSAFPDCDVQLARVPAFCVKLLSIPLACRLKFLQRMTCCFNYCLYEEFIRASGPVFFNFVSCTVCWLWQRDSPVQLQMSGSVLICGGSSKVFSCKSRCPSSLSTLLSFFF